MNGVGRITENKWMRRLRSDLRIVLDLILRSDLRFGPAQNKHLVVRTDGHWPFRASGLLEPLARLAKEGEKICRASGPAVNVEACVNKDLSPLQWYILCGLYLTSSIFAVIVVVFLLDNDSPDARTASAASEKAGLATAYRQDYSSEEPEREREDR